MYEISSISSVDAIFLSNDVIPRGVYSVKKAQKNTVEAIDPKTNFRLPIN